MEPTRTIVVRKLSKEKIILARFLERSKRQRALIDHILIEREREKEGGGGKGSRGDFNVPLPLVPLLREPFSPSKDKIVYTVGKKVAVKYRYNEPLSGPFKRGEPEGGPFWEGGRRKRIENNKLKRLKKATGRKFPSSPLSLTDREGKWTLDLVRREENSWIRVFRCWTTVGELVSYRPTSTFQLEGEGRGLGRT